MAGHALQALGRVDDLLHRGVLLVHLPQGLGEGERGVQRHVQGVGDLLGNGVHVRIGDVQRPAHVSNGPLGGHGPKGHDLGHVVTAVLSVHIVDDLSPAAVAEVHVNIGHGHALRVQKSLEVQGVFHGVHVGDVHAVGDHRPGGRATPRPHRDVMGLGVADEVRDDQKIFDEPHAADHGHLIV